MLDGIDGAQDHAARGQCVEVRRICGVTNDLSSRSIFLNHDDHVVIPIGNC